jgi:hypothetical protein
MESPEMWDLLTASLSVSNLNDVPSAWTFLVAQGLVRDEPGHRAAFGRFAEHEVAHPITGPSAAMRVARRLREAGIATPLGEERDPWGRTAASRLAAQNEQRRPWWRFW